MARRGSYAKGIAKREEILNTALDIVARVGYSRATVRELAQAVGLSQTGLLHYFGTKEQLFVEILRRRDEVDQEVLNGVATSGEAPLDLAKAVTTLQRRNAQVPGLVQLYSRFSSEAAEAGHPAHEFFRDRYLSVRSGGAAVIREQQEAGALPPGLDADRLAVIVFALVDGLQSQWMYDSEIDMADHLGYFWSLLGERAAAEDEPAKRSASTTRSPTRT
jgi:AcrR family transcriptional regulator